MVGSSSNLVGVERVPARGYLFVRSRFTEPSAAVWTARLLNESRMSTERTARLQQYGETLAELRRYL